MESIKSLRRFTNLPVTIKTDSPHFFDEQFDSNVTFEIFKRDAQKQQFKTHEKLFMLEQLPYDITFCVDTDTIFLDNPEYLLSLKEYDLQICRETFFKQPPVKLLKIFNTGFFVAKRNEKWSRMMELAIDVFLNHDKYPELDYGCKSRPGEGDQWHINQAIDRVFDMSIGILPQQWNVRKPMLDHIDNPKLLHCRGEELMDRLKIKYDFPLYYLGCNPIFGTNRLKDYKIK